MSILVHCPSGCVVTAHNNRRGKIIVCRECQASIRVPRKGSKTELAGKSQIVYTAHWIAAPNELGNDPVNLNDPGRVPFQQLSEPKVVVDAVVQAVDGLQGALHRGHFESTPESDKRDSFAAKAEIDSPRALRKQEIDVAIIVERPVAYSSDIGEVMIEFDRKERHDPERDRLWLTRFYALCLAIIAVVNCVPVGVFLLAYAPQSWDATLPRWAFVLIFVSIAFLSYWIYLWQLADWSSLLMVSLFVLLTACVYGFLAAGLWLGTPESWIARVLQLPHAYYQFGPIWGGIMFCLLVLTSFTLGRDALNWQSSWSVRLSSV